MNLTTIQQLVEELLRAQDVEKQAEETLKEAKEIVRRISEELIPEAFDEINMEADTEEDMLTSLKLADGREIKLEDYCHARLPKDEDLRSQAISWLDENGYGDIVKADVVAKFGKGENLEFLLDFLSENGVNFTKKEDVHWKTLENLIKEQRELGNIGDEEKKMFGAYFGRRTKVK